MGCAGTGRLTLRALSAAELLLYAEDPIVFCTGLGHVCSGSHEPWFRALLIREAGIMQENPVCAEWRAFRLMIDEELHAVVGSIDFKSAPKNGTVEIGYGVDGPWRGRGYATEAVLLMVDIAFASGSVDRIVAETEDGNPASDRVLVKAGFLRVGRNGDNNLYELKKTEKKRK
jgi:RimJ/RimL family protein N-acetyltransferase